MDPSLSLPQAVRFGDFEADLRARELRRRGVKIRLPDQSFQILAMLLEHSGELVTREEIRKTLWPSDTFVDFDHGLNNAVNRLRETLGDSADTPRFIETLPRRGYRFITTLNGAGPTNASIVSEAQPAEAKLDQVIAVSAQREEIPPNKSYRWLVLAAAPLLALALLIAFQPWKTHDRPPSRSFILPPEGARFHLTRDDGGSVALSPDGTKLAFIAVDAKKSARIWVRPLGSLSAQSLEGTEGATFPFWSPDGRWIAFFSDADRSLKKISLAGGPAVALCEAPHGRGGTWTHQGTILFTPGIFTGLFKISDSGGTPSPVTSVDHSIHTSHRWPKFLPDGQHFTYLAVNHRHDASHDGIYLGSLDGKPNKRLVASHADATFASGYLFFLLKDVLMAQTFDPEHGELRGEAWPTIEKVVYDPSIWKAVFDVSEHGVMAYQQGGYVSGSQLRWVDRSGKPLGVVGEPGFLSHPTLSRDGRKLLVGRVAQFGHYNDLWVYDLARGLSARITFEDEDTSSGIWSHDGRRILFPAKGKQHTSIYQLDVGGEGTKRLVLETGADIAPSDISRDGRFLLYGAADGRLWAYTMSGENLPFPLLEHGSQHEGQFSSDGRWVAYTSNDSGRDEVYVVPFHGLEKSDAPIGTTFHGKWQISASGGHCPRWRRDGEELFFLTPDNTLMSVAVWRGVANFRVGAARPLFGLASISPVPNATDPIYDHFDVSRNGGRFIINGGVPPESTAPITLVENWLSDLKK